MNQQLSLPVGLTDAATFENFYSGRSAEAVKRIQYAVLPSSGDRCIYIWGEPGSGKTHLLHAAMRRAAEHEVRSVYLPLFDKTLTIDALEGLDETDLIGVDDVQAIAKRPYWEAALFSVHERVYTRRATLLVTGNAPPAQLTLSMRDLATRLAGRLVYQIVPLNDEEKLGALKLRAKHRGFVIGDDVARYILQRYPRDAKALFSLLDRIDRASLAQQRRITIPFLRSLEQDDAG